MIIACAVLILLYTMRYYSFDNPNVFGSLFYSTSIFPPFGISLLRSFCWLVRRKAIFFHSFWGLLCNLDNFAHFIFGFRIQEDIITQSTK